MKGHIIGSVPYGYIKENKMLKINEEEKQILTRMFEDYASGKTILQITEKIFEIHKKRVGNNNSLNSLKSNLQKTNTSISNIMSAIEKGILTDTTKQRLEELENQKKDLQEKLIIEQSKQQFELTKENIQNYFKFTMKQCPDRAIELFIQKVNIYENKIEISLNYSLNTNISKTETTSKKLFKRNIYIYS